MLIKVYAFVVLAACAKKGELLDNEVVGRQKMGRIKLPTLKEIYCDASWQKTVSTFDPAPAKFRGPTPGLPIPSNKMPTLYTLFHKFWTPHTLRKICAETNRYASEINPRSKCTPKKLRGGDTWFALHPPELRAFLAISLYMGIKIEPNVRSYWEKSCDFLWCPVISSIMTRNRYEHIIRCLHVHNDHAATTDRSSGDFDKLVKLRWLLDEIRDRCKGMWNLGNKVTVDEMMVQYKGKYCLIRQYMPKKPTKWGIKVWCLTDSTSRYVWTFDVYCGANKGVPGIKGSKKGEAKQGANVVHALLEGLENRGHIVVMDNFFSSVPLFMELLGKGTYATGTVRADRIGLPTALAKKSLYAKSPQGHLEWRMHASKKLSAIVWVDKKPVLVMSTVAPPIHGVGEECPVVSRRVGSVRKDVETSPMHYQYTTYMRGVDVADQLRGEYSSQVRTHKWWHRLFFFLLDTTVVNTWKLHCAQSLTLGNRPLSHKSFQLRLAKVLASHHLRSRKCTSRYNRHVGLLHMPMWSPHRKVCCECRIRCQTYCPCCLGHHMHIGECWAAVHRPIFD